MTTIARAFETESQATEARAKLLEAGLTEDRISMVTPMISSAGDSLRAGKLLGQHREAESYALALEKGQTILLADVHFGTGIAMSEVMDTCNPATLEQVSDIDDPFHRGTPLSFAFGMPVLIRNNAAPLSRFFGLSTESRGRSFLSKWFGGELSESAAPLSSLMGLPPLTRKGKSLSGALGLSELSDQKVGDSSFGFPLLSGNSTPLSSAIGMKCLSNNPSPFSSMFGMGVLTGLNDKTPGEPPAPRY